LGQWKAEPISALILPDTTFVPNSKGYPTLYRPHQSFLRSMIPLFPAAALIVACTGSNSRENPELYLQYLRHITATLPTPSVVDTFASGYQDYLQAPLQPLMDNLDSGTYTVFERDPVKYVQYEEAIFQALQDHHTTPQCNPPVIMVVGAGGRGPLVDCALRASQRAEIPIRVFAVEKNPNALVTLRVKKAEHWGDQVEIIHEDMRRWKAPELADILVSELLGSFGDNELSPECLDGAQAFLKENGISIPCNSTAHLALLSSSKLHAEASAYGERSKMETPYVVMFRKVHEATAPQAVWTFEHPLRPGKGDNLEGKHNKHNCRYAQREFTPGFPMRLDGLAGYFDSCLYKDVYLSIHPETFSDGMFSWFPIYFPIHTPLLIPEGGKVCVRMWRRTAQAHVWYEWSVDIHSREGQYLYRTPIHNLSGRSYKIGM
ncbi:arginine N-methyltransferase 5, partial [Piptocephalis cylindrospora]